MCDSLDGRIVDPTSAVAKRVATPALDALARSGANFVRAYAASPQARARARGGGERARVPSFRARGTFPLTTRRARARSACRRA